MRLSLSAEHDLASGLADAIELTVATNAAVMAAPDHATDPVHIGLDDDVSEYAERVFVAGYAMAKAVVAFPRVSPAVAKIALEFLDDDRPTASYATRLRSIAPARSPLAVLDCGRC